MNDKNLWLPPPDLKISDWADNNREISRESSAEPGHWNTARAPYQREMLNAICDAGTERVVMMTSAQIGKTEIILNTIGYYVDQEPSPILILNPTVEMSETFSKDRLAPMIRDTPCLTSKVADPKSRTSGNTLLHKAFTGGYISMAGANSPASLASRPIRILLCDEVDRYPQSAGSEGDPLSLAMKRTANFWNRKIIWVSTPTIKGISRIEKAFEISTQEEFCVPCPNCSALTPYEWGQINYKNLPEPVMTCPSCGNSFTQSKWHMNNIKGVWRASNPGAKIRGFHVNSFASPWCSWASLCEQYDEAKNTGEEALKVWFNTVLGLPYEYNSWNVNADDISQRGEDYGADLPDGVLCLTAGIDTQDNRLECEIVGWGLNYESWGIEYQVFYGSPATSHVWAKLDEFLSKTWKFKDGSELGLACACIDSAGHFTDEVYSFCKSRKAKRIFPIIGRGTFGLPSVSKPNYNNRKRVALFTVGVSTLKGLLFTRLQAERFQPGYCHFPNNPEKNYTAQYFSGLMSENMRIKNVNGIEKVVWEKRALHVRNEPLDCRVYSMAALAIYNPDLKRLAAKNKHIGVPSETHTPKKNLTLKKRPLTFRKGLSL
nr:MAG: terminase large subunit [Caudoviricetes sp.]